MFAPAGHQEHVAFISQGYISTLKRARDKRETLPCTDDELEMLVYVLMAVRSYFSLRYAYRDGKVTMVSEEIIGTHIKLASEGLLRSQPAAPGA